MMPSFLPHTVLDAMVETKAEKLPPEISVGRTQLRALRDRAIAQGARVLLVFWSELEWVMLAVEVPGEVPPGGASDLIPGLLANPAALEQMRRESRGGRRLVWLALMQPGETPPLRPGYRRSAAPIFIG